MSLSRIGRLVLVFTAITACSDADGPTRPDPNAAAVVIANLATGTSDVDVVVTGLTNPVAIDLDFGFYTSQCALLPAGQEITIDFSSGGTLLASEDVVLDVGELYTILLTSDGTTEHALVLKDDVNIPAGQRAVRLVNATLDEGDVYIFPEGEAMGDAAATDLPYAATAAQPPQYLLRADEQTVVRFFEPGVSLGDPRAEQSLPPADIAPAATVIFAEEEGALEVFALGPCF